MPDVSKINELIDKINAIIAKLQEIQNDYIGAVNKVIDKIENAINNARYHAMEWLQEQLDVLNAKIESIVEKFNKKIEQLIEKLKEWYEKLVFYIKLAAVAMVSAMLGVDLDRESKEAAAEALPTPELPLPEFKIEVPELNVDVDSEVELPRIPLVEIPTIPNMDKSSFDVGNGVTSMFKTSVFDVKEPELPESVLAAYTAEKPEYIPVYSISDLANANTPVTTEYPSGDKNGKYVILDHGHGKDTGGKHSPIDSNGEFGEKGKIPYYEWKWNREIVNMLIPRLEAKGYTVYTVYHNVDKDTDMSIRRSAAQTYAKKIGADLKKKNCIMISVHGNASGNAKKWMKGAGWSVFTYAPENKDPNAKVKYDKDLRNKRFAKNFEASDELAQIFVDTAREMGLKMHGDKKTFNVKWFTMCKPNSCPQVPSILTENFFYDNKEDLKYMLSDKGKKEIVDLHVKAIDKYFFGNKA